MTTLEEKTEANFINIVKVLEIEDMDYTFQFYNIYNGKRWVFKIYKALFDKSMEIRKISPMNIKIIDEEKEKKKIEKDNNGVMIYA